MHYGWCFEENRLGSGLGLLLVCWGFFKRQGFEMTLEKSTD